MIAHSLRPYPSEGLVGSEGVMKADLKLEFGAQRRVDGLDFSFTLELPPHARSLKIPVLKPEIDRVRRDELWKSTCLEIFWGPASGCSYLEMNLSPSGDWNVYAFDSYREGMRPVFDVRVDFAHQFARQRARQNEASVDVFSWTGSLRLDSGQAREFAESLRSSSLVLGATAVLEYEDGGREYWALAHAGKQPDFHLRESFRLRL